MSVGRNDPCPCGSGKKFKKCCLVLDQPKPEDLFWHRLHSRRNELITKILKHAMSVYGEDSICEAWDMFHLWDEEEQPFDADSHENQVFMPWFFYNWFPEFEEESLVPKTAPKIPPAQSLLNTKGGYLEPLQRQYIEECLKVPFSFFEITECQPDQGFTLKDVFTGQVLNVVEKSGSKNAGVGDILFGKPVTINDLTTMEATSPFLIPPIHKGPLLKLRKQIERHFKPITSHALERYSIELIEAYQAFHSALLKPGAPRICNTDGEKMEPRELHFEVSSPQVAFDALKDLDCQTPEGELLLEAELDDEKKVVKIEFPWLKKGNNQIKSWDHTVLGHLTIDGKKLIANVNSENRAMLFRELVEKRLGSQARYQTTVIESVEAMFKQSAGSKGDGADFKDQDQLLREHPEVQAKMAEMMMAHWEGWVHEKIPALGGKTPIQAAKTKDGREMLIALLTQFERDAVNRPQVGVTVQTFKKIRDELGLT